MKSSDTSTRASLDQLLQPLPEGRPGPAAGDGSRSGITWARTTAGVAVVLVVLAATLWWITGGRWQMVATPSMGEAAPVGTLVLTRPVTADDVAVGDILTFRSPAAAGHVYTHRVVRIDAGGGLHTRGDINGAEDPAILGSQDLVGRVVARWWGAGWLLRALPILVMGALALWWLPRRWAAPDRRVATRIVGSSVLVAGCAALFKPFVNFLVVTEVPGNDGTQFTLVSTGLLPIRVSASGGDHLDLINGRIGALTASTTSGGNGYQVTSGVHLTPLWWLGMVLMWSTPLVLSLLLAGSSPGPREDDGDDPGAFRRGPHRRTRATDRPRSHRRSTGRRARRAVGALAVAAGLAAGLVAPTQSAFAARVTNAANSAGSNQFFTCRTAATSTQGPAFLAYPLSETTFTTASDVSGNARTGTYATAGVWSAAASRPCPRDTSTSAVVSGGTATTQSFVSGATAVANPTVFSVEIWFQTGATIGGKLIGFGNSQTGTSGQYDRHIYMSNTGQLNFGVYPGTVKVVTSPGTYADGLWHQAVGTLGSTGQRLYVDGVLVASDATTTTGENYTGYWRVGYDNLNNWSNVPSNANFRGSLAWASVYTTALSATLVQQHYAAGK